MIVADVPGHTPEADVTTSADGKGYTPTDRKLVVIQPFDVLITYNSDVSVKVATTEGPTAIGRTAEGVFEAHVYVIAGSTGVTLKVVFPPDPQKLNTEVEATIGIVLTVTEVLGPSQDPLFSAT